MTEQTSVSTNIQAPSPPAFLVHSATPARPLHGEAASRRSTSGTRALPTAAPLAGLDEESRGLVLSSLASFARRELDDERQRTLDREERFPEDLVRALFGEEIGLHLLFLPEAVGGMGAGARDLLAVSEALASMDLGIATSVLATALGTDPIRVGGTQPQRDRWLRAIAEGGLLVAYGVTEPGAGSNVAAIRTRAEPVRTSPDSPVSAYRLSGSKCFITNGSVADLYTVLAQAPGGPSFFVVPRETPGLAPGRKEEKHGIRASDTSELVLENVEVPADHLLGGVEGQGLGQAARVFGYTRLMVAAFGLGAGVDAQRRAVAYARERVQFGSRLIALQGLTHKLILPHAAALQAARAYLQEVASRLDAGEEDLGVEGSVAKLFACEAGNRAADAAMQVHGGYGYIREYHVEKIRRDVRITTIYEGTSEIQQEVVGRGRWRQLLVGSGSLYADLASELLGLGEPGARVGAADLALAAQALSELVRRCRRARLGRQQHVIFLLADAMAALETAAALCRKAAAWQEVLHSVSDGLHTWAHCIGALSRVQSATAAEEVGRIAYRVLPETGAPSEGELAGEMGPLLPRLFANAWRGRMEALDFLAASLAEEDLFGDPAMPALQA